MLIFIAKRSEESVKNHPKITIEKLKGQHIETSITSEQNEILTFPKKHWHHNKGIFHIKSTCFIDPYQPQTPTLSPQCSRLYWSSFTFFTGNKSLIYKTVFMYFILLLSSNCTTIQGVVKNCTILRISSITHKKFFESPNNLWLLSTLWKA